MEGAPGAEVGPSEVGGEDADAALSVEERCVGAAERFHDGVVDGDVGALGEYACECWGLGWGVESWRELVHERGDVGLELSERGFGGSCFPEENARVPVVPAVGEVAHGGLE